MVENTYIKVYYLDPKKGLCVDHYNTARFKVSMSSNYNNIVIHDSNIKRGDNEVARYKAWESVKIGSFDSTTGV